MNRQRKRVGRRKWRIRKKEPIRRGLQRKKESVNQWLMCSPFFFDYLIAIEVLVRLSSWQDEERRTRQPVRNENESVHWSRKTQRERERDRQTIGFAAGRLSSLIFSFPLLSLSLSGLFAGYDAVRLILSRSISSFSCRYTLARFLSSLCVLSRFFQL